MSLDGLERKDRRRFLAGVAGAAAAAATCGAWNAAARSAEPRWTMRLSCSSINFTKLPIEQACQRIADAGLRGHRHLVGPRRLPAPRRRAYAPRPREAEGTAGRQQAEALRLLGLRRRVSQVCRTAGQGGRRRGRARQRRPVRSQGTVGPHEGLLRGAEARNRTGREVQLVSGHREPRRLALELARFVQGVCRTEPQSARGHRAGAVSRPGCASGPSRRRSPSAASSCCSSTPGRTPAARANCRASARPIARPGSPRWPRPVTPGTSIRSCTTSPRPTRWQPRWASRGII